MNIVQIEEVVKNLVTSTASGEFIQSDFIFELLLAYGHRKQSVTRLKTGERNLARDEVDTVLWKRNLYFKVDKNSELHGVIDDMQKEKVVNRHKIRFVIVTDFETFLAIDTKTGDSLDIEFKDLAKKFDFFLPWAGMEKAVYQGENPADVKAAEKLAKLFDEIKADSFDSSTANDPAKLHELNVFLSRLLFCFFAEDTNIFADNQFSDAIASHTNEDGSDLANYLKRLFTVLNQSEAERPGLPDYLSDFPYVNGGLFKDDIQVPTFSHKSRKILIECGVELDWSDINPDIFGSMFQAVVHTEQRSNMGQHYTSVPNIMKVIEPLFLNDLYEELDKHQDSQKKLLELQERIGKIKIFDPACGSGNFLIIAYKELRKLEMEVLKRLQELEYEKSGQAFQPFSVIKLSQFYGIEIDDFAHEVAILSLWLTEHQMNVAFKDEFGESLPTLPLKNGGNIVSGNATRRDWNEVCSILHESENYILGNPPYLGSKLQSKEQKSDLLECFKDSSIKPKTLDYIFCWFFKANKYIKDSNNSAFAFVSTNSAFQGEQVSSMARTLSYNGNHIFFAHSSFKWTNNARKNAGVTCVIVGSESSLRKSKKTIYSDLNILKASNINTYLIDSRDILVTKRNKPLSNFPRMNFGNMPNDGGGLILSPDEKEDLLRVSSELSKVIKPLVGASEFIRGSKRFCLWIEDKDAEWVLKFPQILQKVEKTKLHRLNSKDASCNALATRSHQFRDMNVASASQIIVPRVTSENRVYIPIGYLGNDSIISDSAMAVYDPEPWLFSVLTSRIHMKWVEIVGGKLETRLRYSATVIYNTFPFPNLSVTQKEALNNSALNILSVRENYSDKTLAQLYDEEKMPNELRNTHEENDKLVESCYRKSPFESDEERLEYLFNLYEKMIAEEQANA